MSSQLPIVQIRRGTKTQWETVGIDIVPLDGEVVLEQSETTPRLKVGDGKRTYGELPYITSNAEAAEVLWQTLVGRPQLAKGEGDEAVVGNDIATNKALSTKATAFGEGTVAGCRGFNILAIDPVGYDSTETAPTEMHLTLDSVEGLAVDDSCSVAINKNYMEMGKITSISENTITINAYPDDLTAAIISTTVVGGGEELAYVFVSTKQTIGTTIFGSAQHAEGCETAALMVASHAEGSATIASGKYSHAEGDSTFAGYAAHAEGQRTKALGGVSHAEGSNTIASGVNSHAEGQLATASGRHSHAEGYQTTAEGKRAHSEGCKTSATGTDSHSEGSSTTASGEQSHAEGQGTTASGWVAHAEGYNTTASSNKSHAEGGNTTASGETAHAEGHITLASGIGAHAEGGNTVAQGEKSHAEGFGSKAYGLYAHAEGYDSIADGQAAHAEGKDARAIGSYSHVEGLNGIAHGHFAHAEGYFTTAGETDKAADSSGAHAEGWKTTATGDGAHAEGNCSRANGDGAHAEGQSTRANGVGAHAEGSGGYAAGNASHAEGQETTASGWVAHAEGYQTTARANKSHAEGEYTTATIDCQHVQGKFNKNDDTAVHIIGWGTRGDYKNIHTVHKDGSAWFKGDIYVGGTDKTTCRARVLTEADMIELKMDLGLIEVRSLDSDYFDDVYIEEYDIMYESFAWTIPAGVLNYFYLESNEVVHSYNTDWALETQEERTVNFTKIYYYDSNKELIYSEEFDPNVKIYRMPDGTAYISTDISNFIAKKWDQVWIRFPALLVQVEVK